jgi:5-methylcytosine-specific restriction endonuclease McrA
MTLSKKTIAKRERISQLKEEFKQRNADGVPVSKRDFKTAMRDWICEQMGIDKTRYYRLNAPIEKLNKHAEWCKQYREKCRKVPYRLLKDRINIFSKRQKPTFNYEDVLAKYPDPKCELTGVPINFEDPKSYSFDHKVPFSKGGASTLDNLQLLNPKVNRMKSDLDQGEFIELCRTIADRNKNSSCPF